MDVFWIALSLVGLLTLTTGLTSSYVERSWVSGPLIALLWGVVIGPFGLSLLQPASWPLDQNALLQHVARGTLGIGLMGVALRLPIGYFKRRCRTLLVLLGVAMPLSVLIVSLSVHWLFQVGWITAAMVGAIASPTDPVVASSIVTGSVAEENLPLKLRRTVSAESGLNDGLALPLVFLPVMLQQRPADQAIWGWVTETVVYEVGGAILLGGLLGLTAGKLLRLAERCNAIKERSLLGFTLALTALTLGVANLLSTDDVLAVFVAGLAFDLNVSRQDRLKEERVQETVNQFFSIPIFALLGLLLPLDVWWQWGLSGVAAVLVTLLLRRLPVLYPLRKALPTLMKRPDALFAGWFGPLGVAALFYAATIVVETGREQVWTITSLLVTSSVVLHGITASPLTIRLGRHARGKRSRTPATA